MTARHAAAAQEMKAPRISPRHGRLGRRAGAELRRRSRRSKPDGHAGRGRLAPPQLSRDRRAIRRYRGKPGAGAAAVRHRRLSARPRRRQARTSAAPRRPAATISPASRACRSSMPGPAGYDAVVIARAQEMRELGISYSEPIYVPHLRLGPALRARRAGRHDRMAGHRRSRGRLSRESSGIFLENYVRYTFVRYGVPYAVSIECFDGGSRFRNDLLPRRRQGRGASSQGAAARRRHAADSAAAARSSRHDRAAGRALDRLHLSRPGRPAPRHRLQAQDRRRRLHRLFQDPLSDGGCAGLRQFAVLHELGQLRRHRPSSAPACAARSRPIAAG